jgi:hypothetical protein
MAIFTVAILLVVGAVWALAAVGGWWMLAAAMAVHFSVSAFVMIEVARVIAGRKPN